MNLHTVNTRMAKLGVLLMLCTQLTACGFHLLGSQMGSNTLPHSFALVGDTDNEIADNLKKLKPTNVAYATPEQADLTLEMSGISTSKQLLSVNAQGTATEYRIGMSVVIQVYDAHRRVLLEPTRLSTSRNWVVGRGYITAEDAEQERLNSDMAQELADSIGYRVRAIWFNQQH